LIGHVGDYGVAYRDHPDHQVRYAHQIPGGWAIDVVDGLGARNAGPACAAIEFGTSASGPVGIAYYDTGLGDLDFAGQGGPAWAHPWLDMEGDVGNALACSHDPGSPADTMSIVYTTRAGDLKYYERPAAVVGVTPQSAHGGMHATWQRDPAHAGGTVRFVMPASGLAR